MHAGPGMLHLGHIFSKNKEYPEIECYFCIISLETIEMKRNILSIIFSALLLFCLATTARAQTIRPEAIGSNLILSAVEKYNERDIEGALALLKEAVAENPEDDAAWYYIAQCAIAKNDAEMAEQALRMASEIDPDNFWYRYRLARLYSLTSRPELTVDMYEKLLEDFPKKRELYFDLVEMYASQREYEKALDTLKEIETVFGMTESIAMYRFNLLRMLDKPEEAFASLEDYNKEYSSPYVLSTLADYQMSMYNDSTALAYYDEALDLAPDYAPALLGKAETLRLTRKYNEYFDILGRYVADPETPAVAKSDYLMAVVQRTEPKFLSSFRLQIDSVMNSALQVHPTDSMMLQTAAV